MSNNNHELSNLDQEILDITDQCVRCGMCLPHCPTNQLTNLEGNSPRGRIALWQNLAKNKLELTDKTQEYLNNCLSCGACANNCPADVDFLQLQDLGKNLMLTKSVSKGATKKLISIEQVLTKLMIIIFSSQKLTRLSHYSLFFYQKSQTGWLISKLLNLFTKGQKLNNLYETLPNLSWPRQIKTNSYAKQAKHHDITDVILFTGCVNTLADQQVIQAAVSIINKLGINTHTLPSLHCCGALYKHNGYLKQFDNLTSTNNKAIDDILTNNTKISHLLTIDTGCHKEIKSQFRGKKTITIETLEQFIVDLVKAKPDLISQPLENSTDNANSPDIYLYSPCSQREQVKQPLISQSLLSLIIPKDKIKTINTGYGCCGAAGSYMVSNPQMASKFANFIIDQLLKDAPNIKQSTVKDVIICTSNIGCKLHLSKTLATTYSLPITFMHPLQIFEKFLRQAP